MKINLKAHWQQIEIPPSSEKILKTSKKKVEAKCCEAARMLKDKIEPARIVSQKKEIEALEEDCAFWEGQQEWLIDIERKFHSEPWDRDLIFEQVAALIADAREAESDWSQEQERCASLNFGRDSFFFSLYQPQIATLLESYEKTIEAARAVAELGELFLSYHEKFNTLRNENYTALSDEAHKGNNGRSTSQYKECPVNCETSSFPAFFSSAKRLAKALVTYLAASSILPKEAPALILQHIPALSTPTFNALSSATSLNSLGSIGIASFLLSQLPGAAGLEERVSPLPLRNSKMFQHLDEANLERPTLTPYLHAASSTALSSRDLAPQTLLDPFDQNPIDKTLNRETGRKQKKSRKPSHTYKAISQQTSTLKAVNPYAKSHQSLVSDNDVSTISHETRRQLQQTVIFVGSEFQINTDTTRDVLPTVAGLTGGGFIVTWYDATNAKIHGQLYSSTASAIGSEFQINTDTTTDYTPTVAGLTGGGFVVTWYDTTNYKIHGQLYSSTASAIGSEFQVNTDTTQDVVPTVAGLTGGGFIVTWYDITNNKIHGQLYSSTASAIGSEFQINTDTTADYYPTVAGLTGGGFIVTWYDNTSHKIHGQLYSSTASTIGSEFQVNTDTTSDQNPTVASLTGGEFIVTWYDTTNAKIHGQLYSSTASPIGSEFQVNTDTTSDLSPTVAGLTGGGFVVTWYDNTNNKIHGQLFSSTASAIGSEFQINTDTTMDLRPTVASLTGGEFIVTWYDTTNYQIHGQLFSDILPTSQPSLQPTSQPSTPTSLPSTQPTKPTSQPTGRPTDQPTSQPICKPTNQPSGQPTTQPTKQPIGHPTAQPTRQPRGQPTNQPISHPSGQPTEQPTNQPTDQPTDQPTSHPSSQPMGHPTAQPTNQPSGQPTNQPINHPSGQPTTQPTNQPTDQPTDHPTSLSSGQPTDQPTSLPSGQPTTQPIGKPTNQPTDQPSDQPTDQPSSHPSSNPSDHPSSKPSEQPTEQPSLIPSAFPSAQPSNQPSDNPSEQPTSEPSSQPSNSPSTQPSSLPSNQPSSNPSSEPSSQPSNQPSRNPTDQPTSLPSSHPSDHPSNKPSGQPTRQPSLIPIAFPSEQPSNQPSNNPSNQPSSKPSSQPSNSPITQPSSSPSNQPSNNPSSEPSSPPSNQPTQEPTPQSSSLPSTEPSGYPSSEPFTQPSNQPISQPSLIPSAYPSGQPSSAPSEQPTAFPSNEPSSVPSGHPSSKPTEESSTQPSTQPSAQPFDQPTSQPSVQPASLPTTQPTDQPSRQPIANPTALPSGQPTSLPTGQYSALLKGWTALLGPESAGNGIGFLNNPDLFTFGGNHPSSLFHLNASTGALLGRYPLLWDQTKNFLASPLYNRLNFLGSWNQSTLLASGALTDQSFNGFYTIHSGIDYNTAVLHPYYNLAIAFGNDALNRSVATLFNPELSSSVSFYFPLPFSSQKVATSSSSTDSFFAGKSRDSRQEIDVGVFSFSSSPKVTQLAKLTFGNNGTLQNSENLVTAVTLIPDTQDAMISGEIDLGQGLNGYLARMGSLNSLKTIVCAQKVQGCGPFRNLFSANNQLYGICNTKGSQYTFSKLKIARINPETCEPISLHQQITGPGNLTCFQVTPTPTGFAIGCALNQNQALIFSIDQNLTFNHLPPRYKSALENDLSTQPLSLALNPLLSIPLKGTYFIPTAMSGSFSIAPQNFTQILPENYARYVPLPTHSPTRSPTAMPSMTASPTFAPSTGKPSILPSSYPTIRPTISCYPTNHPTTSLPTGTQAPTVSFAPSSTPTSQPTGAPSEKSFSFSKAPIAFSSLIPTRAPTPSLFATAEPNLRKTHLPTHNRRTDYPTPYLNQSINFTPTSHPIYVYDPYKNMSSVSYLENSWGSTDFILMYALLAVNLGIAVYGFCIMEPEDDDPYKKRVLSPEEDDSKFGQQNIRENNADDPNRLNQERSDAAFNSPIFSSEQDKDQFNSLSSLSMTLGTGNTTALKGAEEDTLVPSETSQRNSFLENFEDDELSISSQNGTSSTLPSNVDEDKELEENSLSDSSWNLSLLSSLSIQERNSLSDSPSLSLSDQSRDIDNNFYPSKSSTEEM